MTNSVLARPRGAPVPDEKDVKALHEALERYVACAFVSDDIVEVRRLPSTRSSFHKAAELPALAGELLKDNRGRENIYVGINPRKREGGTTAKDVLLARCLVADFDNITLDEARCRWKEAGLPPATLALNSGHGFHVYLRLKEPIADLALWARLQKGLAAKVSSDPKIHDAPRILRLPEFVNFKAPEAKSVLLSAAVERAYDLGDLPLWLASPSAVAVSTSVPPAARETPPTDADRLQEATAYLDKVSGWEPWQDQCVRLWIISDKLIKELQLSEDTALNVIMEEYAWKCNPAWSEQQWRHWLREYAITCGVEEIEDDDEVEDESGRPGEESVVSVPAIAHGLPATSSSSHGFPGVKAGGGGLFNPKRFGDFQVQEATGYLIDRLLPRGLITLLSARFKTGKTTLLSHLLVLLDGGGTFCGLEVKSAKVIYISEESEGLWLKRIEKHGLPTETLGDCRPFDGKPDLQTWKKYINEVAERVSKEKIELVVIDTLANLGPVKDECNNSEVAEYMTPLRAINKAGAAVLVIHHHGWAGSHLRGSSALGGFVDVLIDFYRVDENDKKNRQRKLIVEGRPDDLIPTLTIELAEDQSGYTAVSGQEPAGKPAAPDAASIMKQIAPDNDVGWTAEEFLSHWTTEKPPKSKTLKNIASAAIKNGGLRLVSGGKPGQQARYAKPKCPPPEQK